MATIEGILARRGDLSTFLVHLTRDKGSVSASDALKGVLRDKLIRATTPMGHAVKLLEVAKRWATKHKSEQVAKLETWQQEQRCVCFTETPLEHVSMLIGDIDGRQCRFGPYGIAITKAQGRRVGANPVWYLDITPGHDWLSTQVEQLVKDAVMTWAFDSQPIASLAPFMEQMGSGYRADGSGRYRKEFWWEREWRKRGNFTLPNRFVVLCPSAEFADFRVLVAPNTPIIDPSWGLEQMIACLAGFEERDRGPFVG